MAHPDRAELTRDVPSAAAGDRDAFARLIGSTRAMVASIALAIVGDVVTSEDVAQDVYLAVWQGLPRLRETDRFLPWLRQMTRNRAYDALRRDLRSTTRPTAARSESVLDEVADPRPDAAASLVDAEERAALAAALRGLPKDAGEVLVLFYREGRSVSEVSALLELGEPAVKKRLQRARDILRASTLARLEGALARTAPGAAFTVAVLAAMSVAAPNTATAAVPLGAFGAKSGAKWAAAKLGAALGATLFGALTGALGAFAGARAVMRRARDDDERRQLRKMAWVGGATTFLCALSLPLNDRLLPSLGPALTFALLIAIVGVNRFVWLPRIIARRQALERAEDRGAAARQRRERWRASLGFLFGVVAGGAALLYALWQRFHH